MHSTARRAILATAALAAVAALASPAQACDRYAADVAHGGTAAGDGSAARPVTTIRRLSQLLTPGQVGCVRSGSVIDTTAGWGILAGTGERGKPITLQAEPGGAAAIRGPLEIPSTSHDVVIRDLSIGWADSPYRKNTLVTVFGDRVSLIGNDISYPFGICLYAGRIDAFTAGAPFDAAEDLTVRANRVHDCGTSPAVTWTAQDSGAHGIYLANVERGLISENLVYRARYRGLQTWPRAVDVVIERNLFDLNATQVNIGASHDYAQKFASTGVIVRRNVMSRRVSDFYPGVNESQVFGNFGAQGALGVGNRIDDNCMEPAAQVKGTGVTAGVQVTGMAAYRGADAGDYVQLAGSACVGYGPASTQPAAVAGPPALAFDGSPCTVTGTAGPDTLRGGAGRDVICGLGGDDVLLPGAGDDIVDGGDGRDRISYDGAATGVVVNIGQASAWDASGGTAVGWDRFGGIEGARGGAAADVLVGSAARDDLDGGPGRDALYGYAGDDVLEGRDGAVDDLACGDGIDTVAADAIDRPAGCESATPRDDAQAAPAPPARRTRWWRRRAWRDAKPISATSLTRDVTAPRVSLLRSSRSGHVAGWRILRLRADDDAGSGVSRVEVGVVRTDRGRCRGFDGIRFARRACASARRLLVPAAVRPDGTFALRLAGLTPGRYELRLRASDFAGNTRAADAASFVLR